MQNGASLVSTFFYNNRLQPCCISVKSSGSAPANCTSTTVGNVLDFTYSFDTDPGTGVVNNGNVASIANNRNTDRTQSFTYDELNRIKTAKTQATTGSHCWGEVFGYDIWANLLSIGGISPDYDGCVKENLSVGVDEKNQVAGNGYDAAGNVTADGSLSMAYDAENRMTSAAGVSYTYDGDGRRVRKSNGKLYWGGMSGLDALVETDGASNTPTEYVFFNGRRIARRNPNGSVFYYFADHLGSSRVVTNTAGTVVEESDFYPFGGERIVVNNDPNPYKFTGKERDTETNLDYFVARYYSSGYGRFLQADLPFADQHVREPQSWNLYAYARGNPLVYVDPSGRACAPALLNTNSLFCVRADTYASVDRILRDKTRFFAAASAVSLYGANTDAGADLDVSLSPLVGVSGTTSAFFSKLGEDLEKMNWNIVKSIQDGSLSGENLDAQIVQMEQTTVQEALDDLKKTNPEEYARLITDANKALNPGKVARDLADFPSDKAFIQILDQVRRDLGRDIDFARQSDREAIGNKLIEHVRKTHGCDVTDNRAVGC